MLPARDAAAQIPVVFVATFDPVATGLVASLARPGGNITGMTSISGDVIAKRLQLVIRAHPASHQDCGLWCAKAARHWPVCAGNPGCGTEYGHRASDENVRDANDLDAVFAAVKEANVLLVADDAEFTAHRTKLANLALKHRLAAISGLKEMVEAGSLMAYGGSFAELYRRAASHVRKILQGMSPAELPVEQPTKFELIINLKTAKAIGVTVPPSARPCRRGDRMRRREFIALLEARRRRGRFGVAADGDAGDRISPSWFTRSKRKIRRRISQRAW